MLRPSQRHFANENLDPRLRAGLVGHWIGGGNGLTWFDRSGLGRHGAITGGAVWTLGEGGKRSAVAFDGSDDRVTVGGPASLYGLSTDLTVLAWIKTTGTGWCAFSNGRGDNGGWGIASFGIGLPNVLNTYVGGAWRNGQTVINDGRWHHVGYTLSSQVGGSLQFYADGRTDGALLTGTGSHSGGGGAGVLFGSTSASQYYFAGTADDARVYSRALSSAEVALLAQPSFQSVVPRRWYWPRPIPNVRRSISISGSRASYSLQGSPSSHSISGSRSSYLIEGS